MTEFQLGFAFGVGFCCALLVVVGVLIVRHDARR